MILISIILNVLLFFMSMGSDYVSELRPLTGPFFIPHMIYESGEPGGMIMTGENRRTRRKTCLSATLSTTNPTWIDPGVKLVLRSERPATNDLSHGTAHVKVKQCRYTPWRRLGERKYSSYSFTTSAVDGGECSASRPSLALPPEKGPPVPIVQEAGWAPEPVWT
jgi:hypothetical protein